MSHSARSKRMARHHERTRKGASLNLVSLMDIFTILVFFLLVNSSDVETLPNAKDLQLPESIAEQKAKETVVVLIGETDIIVQGTPIAKIADVIDQDGNDIAVTGVQDSLGYSRSVDLALCSCLYVIPVFVDSGGDPVAPGAVAVEFLIKE